MTKGKVGLAPFLRAATHRGGNTTLIFGLAAAAVCALGGMGIDFSRTRSTGAKLQDAADGAALDATIQLAKDAATNHGQLQSRAVAFVRPALSQTSGTSGGSVKLTVEAVTPARVTVEVNQEQHLAFGGLFRINKLAVTRKATALAGDTTPICLLLLAPAAAQAWKISGTSDTRAIRCAAQVNSSSSQALASNGGARVTTVRTVVVGPTQGSNGWTPRPQFQQAPLADPFAEKMPWPANAACTYRLPQVRTPLSLAPGVICGGLDIGNGGLVVLAPGTYVVQDGNINVTSGGVLDGSAGVTLVITSATGAVKLQSGGSLLLTSPKAGHWKDVVLAIKPQPQEVASELIGGGEFELDGIVYMPSQLLKMSGGASLEKRESPRSYVSNRIEVGGNGQIFMRAQPGRIVAPANVRLVH